MELQNKISLSNNEKYLNKVLDDCFIIGYDEESYLYVARNYAFAPDDVDGAIFVAAKRELSIGERISVKIVDCDSYSLTGEEVE